MKHKIIILLVLSLLASAVNLSAFDRKIKVEKPDLEKIKSETTNPKSKYYYPRLLKQFMSNDTVMLIDDYRYFYYGTLFQEDYDPYREPYDKERLEQIQKYYYKTSHTREEKDAMMKYAREALNDNPVDLVQLKNLVYVYEKNRKDNLAKIWKHKLNHLLYVIFSSGTGLDTENAWLVVYPRQEFDIFNIYGIPVAEQNYEAPHYDHFVLARKIDNADNYYFNLGPVLQQYYMKHPSELITDDSDSNFNEN